VWAHVFFSLREELPESGTIGPYVGVCLTLLEIAKVLSNVVGPFYTPTSNKESSSHSTSLTIVSVVSCLNLALVVGVH
jgi:hypothetical protein